MHHHTLCLFANLFLPSECKIKWTSQSSILINFKILPEIYRDFTGIRFFSPGCNTRLFFMKVWNLPEEMNFYLYRELLRWLISLPGWKVSWLICRWYNYSDNFRKFSFLLELSTRTILTYHRIAKMYPVNSRKLSEYLYMIYKKLRYYFLNMSETDDLSLFIEFWMLSSEIQLRVHHGILSES